MLHRDFAGHSIRTLALSLLLFTNAAAQKDVEPKPQPAIDAVLEAFNSFRVVGIGDVHRTKDINDFILALVRHPEFAGKVNDIVVEGTNSFLQPTLDRYVNGEDVPYEEARKLWREETSPFGGSDFKAQLFQLVRAVNSGRPAQARIRIVAAEAPVDWNTQGGREGADMDRRESRIASVVQTEVLARGRKALMFYGTGHLRRDTPYASAVERIESAYPKSVLVITSYVGVAVIDNCTSDPMVNARMRSWPVPSVVRVSGTWLMDLVRQEAAARPQVPLFAPKPATDPSRSPIDAYLYLGAPHLLLREFPSVFTFADSGYLALLHERQSRMGMPTIDARTDPARVANQDRDMLRCAVKN